MRLHGCPCGQSLVLKVLQITLINFYLEYGFVGVQDISY